MLENVAGNSFSGALKQATGLVTTAKFWDATPAAFAAHIKYRHDPGVDEQMERSRRRLVFRTARYRAPFSSLTP